MPRQRPALSLALLAFAQLIIALDYNIVYVALPRIGTELGFTGQTLQWVVSAYAVAFGGTLLLGGRAADLLGRRRVFVFALGLYGISSLLGGLATSPGVMIGARVVQGLGGALLFPATLSLVNTLFPEGPRRNRALAVWGGAGASGLTLGALLGGLLTATFGWEAVFYVNVPLAALGILAAFLVIPADPPRAARRSFDLPGALTATAGVTFLVYVLVQGPESGWTSPGILTGAALAVVLLAAFAVIETRTADPLMPLRLFGNRALLSAMVITAVFHGVFSTLPYFLTVLLQTANGYGALATGLAFLVPSVAIAAGTQLGERLATRLGTRGTLLIGVAVAAPGTALFALGIAADGGYGALVPGLVVSGLGQGVIWTGMWIAAASGVAPGEQGVASGMASTTQQVGGAVGLALLVAVAGSGLSGGGTDTALADGIGTSVYIAAAGLLVALVAALALPRKPRTAAPRPAAELVN